MRILLDEDLPRRLGALLVGHDASTVQRSGWSGIKNGKLLALAAARFDVFLTMDGNLEFQQNLATLPTAILVVEAVSNRMEHLVPVVPSILKELNQLPPKGLRRVAAFARDR
jgi:predicted nuclease of predicted toxin-antitoxin system